MIPVKAQIDIRLRVLHHYLPKLLLMYITAETDTRLSREVRELRVSIEALKWEVAQWRCPKCGAGVTHR